jgi:hypothetical protein
MPGAIPNPLWVFRIVHMDNIEFILTHGMFTKDHPNRDPNYINIADLRIQKLRETQPVRIPNRGNLSDYVPFYFGPLSPMLYRIKTGYGVKQIDQSAIVYICCKVDKLKTECPNIIFTDGHAKPIDTRHFDDFNQLSEIDWNMVNQHDWKNTDEDNDRMRRKQAELLVHSHVPANCIGAIAVYNAASKTKVETIMKNLKLQIPVIVKTNYYY